MPRLECSIKAFSYGHWQLRKCFRGPFKLTEATLATSDCRKIQVRSSNRVELYLALRNNSTFHRPAVFVADHSQRRRSLPDSRCVDHGTATDN